MQAYNAQAAVDSLHQIIVACDLTNEAPDARHLPGLLEQMRERTSATPLQVSADAGYFSHANVSAIEALGAEAFVAPERVPHALWRSTVVPEPLGADATPKEAMLHKLATERGKAAYRKRQSTVEPVFGQIKSARGLQQVLHRGLDKVGCLWRFACAVHNFLKIIRNHTRSACPTPSSSTRERRRDPIPATTPNTAWLERRNDPISASHGAAAASL